MKTLAFRKETIRFEDHPRFADVRIAKLVTGNITQSISVSMLDIAPQTEIPVHTHDPQVDSIYVIEGVGEAYINGGWNGINTGDYIFVPEKVEHGVRNTGHGPLRLFIVHSPPLF